MTLADARAALKGRVPVAIDPVISDAEIDAILANHLRYSTYAAATAYAIGDRVRVSTNGRMYRCVVAGTSGASTTPPTWPTANWAFVKQQLGDGTGDLLWEDEGADHIGAYDLSGAERDVWLLKAARCEDKVDWSNPNGSQRASQEAENYRRRANKVYGTWIA